MLYRVIVRDNKRGDTSYASNVCRMKYALQDKSESQENNQRLKSEAYRPTKLLCCCKALLWRTGLYSKGQLSVSFQR